MKVREIISELRKNPEQNVKSTPDEQLAELVSRYGDTNLFVRLSGVSKFGANPIATYESTPLGFYGYPVDYAIDVGINRLPYPEPDSSDSRYVIVFRLTDDAVVWDLRENDKLLLDKVRDV